VLDKIRADYVRHGRALRNPALWALAVYRFGNWSNELPGPARWLTSKAYGAMFLAVEVTSGIVLNREARIGEDFHIVHNGNIKVHPDTVIGDRVGIMQDVTLGTNMDREGAPIVGDDVFIGAGAKILGAVRVGNGARIAANSLVLNDVPDGATAIGVPARVMRYTGRTAKDDESATGREREAEP
jgi:serine O-acetyltransferase